MPGPGNRRGLEAYALVKLGSASQLRFTALNLLKPGNPSASIYQDAGSRHEAGSQSRSARAMRMQYELKL